jgi:hypothetical protein
MRPTLSPKEPNPNPFSRKGAKFAKKTSGNDEGRAAGFIISPVFSANFAPLRENGSGFADLSFVAGLE